LITEWDAGHQILEQLLQEGENAIQHFASQLAKISECYGLDGWLFNIENILDPKYVPQLERLVAVLTKTMHDRIPHSQVIWYDSITTNGELQWQNELNENNR
jgi:mannosyl-glycoprotein endo-beta-N-acetylglucosaminidase